MLFALIAFAFICGIAALASESLDRIIPPRVWDALGIGDDHPHDHV